MAGEFASYSQYYDQGNFAANKRWRPETQAFGKVELPIPSNIRAREINKEPFIRDGASLEHGRWEGYKPFPDPELDPDILVARSPLYPLQRIVGPKAFIKDLMFSYYLLDRLHPNNAFHHMDIVASLGCDQYGYRKSQGKLMWTRKLLDSAGIDMPGNSRLVRMNQYEPSVGIISDSNWPTFYMAHDIRPGAKNSIINSIVHAGEIVHDWTHREQERLGFTSLNPTAERQAMANQLRLAEALYNHPGFFKPDPFENWNPHRITQNYPDYIRNMLTILESFKIDGAGHLANTPGWDDEDIKKHKNRQPNNGLPVIDFR